MLRARPNHRRSFLLLAAGVLAVCVLGAAASVEAAGENLLLFRPHCDKADQKQCAFYRVEDPTSLGTPDMKVGDVLDMDIVLINPNKQPVKRVRAWLAYDAQVLQGSGLSLNLGLPLHVPGETEFSPTQGYLKIAASSESNAEPKDEIFAIARVQFVVKAVPAGNKIPLAFYDVLPTSLGHTFVTTAAGTTVPNILSAPTATLIVKVTGSPAASSSSSSVASASSKAASSAVASSSSGAQVPPLTVSSSSSLSSVNSSSSSSSVSSASSLSSVASSSSSQASSEAPVSAFPLLQVQNVKIGTDGDTVYMTWEKLNSSQVRAYNVYYGTTMGRYIQRRTVSMDTSSVVIHNLPIGTTYYAAVRGVNEAGQETAFSKEVAVQVGNPNASTSPLLVRPQENGPSTADLTAPRNPVETCIGTDCGVPGESGLPSGLAMFLILSAVLGTLLALRRQVIALPSVHE